MLPILQPKEAFLRYLSRLYQHLTVKLPSPFGFKQNSQYSGIVSIKSSQGLQKQWIFFPSQLFNSFLWGIDKCGLFPICLTWVIPSRKMMSHEVQPVTVMCYGGGVSIMSREHERKVWRCAWWGKQLPFLHLILLFLRCVYIVQDNEWGKPLFQRRWRNWLLAALPFCPEYVYNSAVEKPDDIFYPTCAFFVLDLYWNASIYL